MTPAEIAALRERLVSTVARLRRGAPQLDDRRTILHVANLMDAEPLEVALALLDAQAETIARLTAERERARADGIEEAAQLADILMRARNRYWNAETRLVRAQELDDRQAEMRANAELSEAARLLDAAETRFSAIRALAPAPAAEVAG